MGHDLPMGLVKGNPDLRRKQGIVKRKGFQVKNEDREVLSEYKVY